MALRETVIHRNEGVLNPMTGVTTARKCHCANLSLELKHLPAIAPALPGYACSHYRSVIVPLSIHAASGAYSFFDDCPSFQKSHNRRKAARDSSYLAYLYLVDIKALPQRCLHRREHTDDSEGYKCSARYE